MGLWGVRVLGVLWMPGAWRSCVLGPCSHAGALGVLDASALGAAVATATAYWDASDTSGHSVGCALCSDTQDVSDAPCFALHSQVRHFTPLHCAALPALALCAQGGPDALASGSPVADTIAAQQVHSDLLMPVLGRTRGARHP